MDFVSDPAKVTCSIDCGYAVDESDTVLASNSLDTTANSPESFMISMSPLAHFRLL